MLRDIYSSILHRIAVKLSEWNNHSKSHRYLLKAARLGNPLSQYRVGMNYYLGKGCLRSGSEALLWFERSALAGNVDAQFELGVALLDDRDENWCVGSAAPWILSHAEDAYKAQQTALFPGGVSLRKDLQNAFLWIKRAAEGGKPAAQANLGWLHLNGLGCTVDSDAAKKWFELAALSNIPSAVFGLAELYSGFAGHPVRQDLALMWLEKAADLGHVSAMYKLGCLYKSAKTDSAREKSLYYFTLASNERHSAALVELGKLLLLKGDRESVEIAEEKLRIATKAGNVEAALILGQLYYRESSYYADYREAFIWFKIAADRGSIPGQFRVACMYAQGRGVGKNLIQAEHYFVKCAIAGHGLAAFNLGIFYENGDGVKKSLSEAVALYSKAADAGVIEAKVRLAKILIRKGGEFSDLNSAVELLESAVLAGSADGEVALARLLLNLTGDGDIDPRVASLLRNAAAKGSLDASEFIVSLVSKGYLPTELVSTALNTLSGAANSGSVTAQLYMAEIYDKGVVVPKSMKFVEEWLVLAGANRIGSSSTARSMANFKLGVFYCKRNLIDGDIKRGLDCYILAANDGHVLAQYNLGVMYLKGIGVSRDPELAIYWLSKYVEQGNDLDNSIQKMIDALGYTGAMSTSERPAIHS